MIEPSMNFSINPKTYMPLYLSAMGDINNKKRYEYYYIKLCQCINTTNNSFEYKTISNLGKLLGINSRSHIYDWLNLLEKCNLVKRIDNYMYINPKYCTKCDKVEDYIFKMFEEK